MTNDLVVRQVTTTEDLAFFELEHRAMANQPNWRPPPRAWMTRLFDPGQNPLYRHATVARFIAQRGADTRGRIVAWTDDRATGIGFFGFFDVVDDPEAGQELVTFAADWCRAQGVLTVRGPIDFWPICSIGLPVSGFDLPNTFALHHGAPHYAGCVTAAGFTPTEELYTWQFGNEPVPAPAVGIARATFTNPALTLIPFDAESDEHWALVHELYQQCYADHGWYLPMEAGELRVIGADFVAPEVSFLAFVRGTPAAMAVGLRNVVESSLRVGQLMVPEPIQAIARLSRRPESFRQWLFAVAPPFRGRTLGHLSTALYVRVREQAAEAGYERGEAAWTQALDAHRNAGFTAVGARRDKRYQVYERRWPA